MEYYKISINLPNQNTPDIILYSGNFDESEQAKQDFFDDMITEYHENNVNTYIWQLEHPDTEYEYNGNWEEIDEEEFNILKDSYEDYSDYGLE